MSDYLLGLYEMAMPAGIGWGEKLRTAGEAGFDYVEMSIDESDEKQARLEMDRTQRRELLLTMGRAGVPIRSVCLSAHRKFPMGSRDPEVRRRSMEIMERAVGLAADLGVRTIQLAGYDIYYEPHSPETEALFAENLGKAAEMAARDGGVPGYRKSDQRGRAPSRRRRRGSSERPGTPDGCPSEGDGTRKIPGGALWDRRGGLPQNDRRRVAFGRAAVRDGALAGGRRVERGHLRRPVADADDSGRLLCPLTGCGCGILVGREC